MLDHKPVAALLGQAGIELALDGCVRSGLVGRTSTNSCLTAPCH
jgi:hypothetical protein